MRKNKYLPIKSAVDDGYCQQIIITVGNPGDCINGAKFEILTLLLLYANEAQPPSLAK